MAKRSNHPIRKKRPGERQEKVPDAYLLAKKRGAQCRGEKQEGMRGATTIGTSMRLSGKKKCAVPGKRKKGLSLRQERANLYLRRKVTCRHRTSCIARGNLESNNQHIKGEGVT